MFAATIPDHDFEVLRAPSRPIVIAFAAALVAALVARATRRAS